MFLEGRGLNSSFAIYQDATGKAMDRTLALGIGIGSGYLFETTFIREATSDLTGERGSLMGAIQGLLLAQYEGIAREWTLLLPRLSTRDGRGVDSILDALIRQEWYGLDVR